LDWIDRFAFRGVRFDADSGGNYEWFYGTQLRPLGPIEDELRRRGSEIPFSEMSSLVVFDAVWGASDRLFGDGPLPSDAVTWRAECLSEAIEACERIYQQTGAVL
jgi:hypothetical protein